MKHKNIRNNHDNKIKKSNMPSEEEEVSFPVTPSILP